MRMMANWFLENLTLLITDPEGGKKHVLNMVKNQSLNCHGGKKPCEIDSVCIHGDNDSSLSTAKSIRETCFKMDCVKNL